LYNAFAERLGMQSIPCHTLLFEVCVKEIEKEEEGNIFSQHCPLKLVPSLPRHATNSTAIGMVTCISKREEEDYSKRYG
jgi:hypothetical protein